jgi:cathepsin L
MNTQEGAITFFRSGMTEDEKSFISFIAKYKRSYLTKHEYAARFNVFKDNLQFIKENNSEMFTVAINKFADLTSAEFKASYTGLKLNGRERNPTPIIGTESVPAEVDWPTKGAVTPVKNQGQCGSCWAFSTTGSVEGAHFLKTGKLVSMSEQQLVDCSTSYGNMGCNGGLMDSAFQYIEKYGIQTEASYPYTAQDGTCTYDATKVATKITGFSDVASKSPAQLKAAVAIGTVSVAIEADQSSFQFYSTGVLAASTCGQNLDHGVLVVGYGTENGTDYWKVKNSWGASWGEAGYIKLQRGDDSSIDTCGVLNQPSYPKE